MKGIHVFIYASSGILRCGLGRCLFGVVLVYVVGATEGLGVCS